MEESSYEKLINAVLRFISVRPRSRKEINDYLVKKNSPKDVLDRVMVRLTELGYADDLKFSQWLFESRQSHKPKGNYFIEHELKSKGVAKDIINAVVQNSGQLSQTDLAKTAISRKLSIWSKLPTALQKRKIYGYLGRQGFDSDTIQTVIDEVMQKSYNSGE
jgi:regulatory protein